MISSAIFDTGQALSSGNLGGSADARRAALPEESRWTDTISPHKTRAEGRERTSLLVRKYGMGRGEAPSI